MPAVRAGQGPGPGGASGPNGERNINQIIPQINVKIIIGTLRQRGMGENKCQGTRIELKK